MEIQAVKHGHNKIRKTLCVAKMIGKQRLSVPCSNGSEDNALFYFFLNRDLRLKVTHS